MTTVKVYLNEARGSFFGFQPGKAALRLAATFELTLPSVRLVEGKPIDVLNRVYEQLNIGGDMIPAEPWTEVYRAAGNRSLSVGDVIAIGENAWGVASIGFNTIATAALVAAIRKGQHSG